MERPIRILIVDDDSDYLFTTETLLKREGYETVTAMDGETAMALIRDAAPDLVLLDVMMETLYSGFEICKEIRNDPKLKDIPIIGISAMVEDLAVSYDKYPDYVYFSPDEFIEKPVDKHHLLKRIRAALKTADIRHKEPVWKKQMRDHQMDKFVKSYS